MLRKGTVGSGPGKDDIARARCGGAAGRQVSTPSGFSATCTAMRAPLIVSDRSGDASLDLLIAKQRASLDEKGKKRDLQPGGTQAGMRDGQTEDGGSTATAE